LCEKSIFEASLTDFDNLYDEPQTIGSLPAVIEQLLKDRFDLQHLIPDSFVHQSC
jgi:hypothetical protein